METRKETGRIEGFSDAVFAIAITFLALDLKVPTPGKTGLIAQLLSDWRDHLAFLAAFGSIAVMYMCHHRLFKMISRTSGAIFLLNFVVLLGIVTIPFWTNVMVEYARDPGRIVAAALRSGTIVVIVAVYNLLLSHVVRHRSLDPTVGPQSVRFVGRVLRLALVLYLVAFLIALFSDVGNTLFNVLIAVGLILLASGQPDQG